ncbi:MAG: methyltransferase domain-containing protein [Firmicutes bacterium]|nr:methyltransferase domain-containing protein [Bacillota bacterium]
MKPLHMARNFIRACVCNGEQVIDATAGNGYDTFFLAQQVGDGGKVFSFDVQEEALGRTRKLLEEKNLLHRVVLILDGHEHISYHVEKPVAAIMFNLGYLPGGDHSIITRPKTTVRALQAGLSMLKPQGIITLVVYTGHEGGEEEKRALISLCQRLDQKQFTVLHYSMVNQVNDPPSLIVVEKIH